MDELAQTINIQLAAAMRAPGPFTLAVLLAAIVVWRILAWRYSSQIEILKHRLELRDDTIGKYERGGSLPQVNRTEIPDQIPKKEREIFDRNIEPSSVVDNKKCDKSLDYTLLPSNITVENTKRYLS